MKYTLILFTLLFSLPLFCQKKPLQISANVLAAYDFSRMEPYIGYKKGDFGIKGGEIDMLIPIKKNIFLESGYRWKEHWIYWSGTAFGQADLIETTHSISLRPAAQFELFNGALYIRVGSGVLLNISDSNKILVWSDNPALVTFPAAAPIGSYLIFDESFLHTTKFTASWDSRITIDIPISDRFGFNFGYGFNKGFKSYLEGQYLEVLGTGFNLGNVSYQGTYSYLFGGFNYTF